MKAIVMSHEDGGTYVLDKAGAFKFVKGYESQPIGQEIELEPVLRKKNEASRERSFFHTFKPVLLAACLTFIVALGGFIWAWNSQSLSIYVDSNFSVELQFNRFNRLISTRALNDDGVEIADNLGTGLTPAEAVVSVVRAAKQNTNGEPPAVLISFPNCTSYDAETPAIATAISQNELAHLDITKLYAGRYRALARELSVSPGRLRLVKYMYDNSPQTLDELLDKPLVDLKDAVTFIERPCPA
ncbi:MAG: hypothetical protein FWE06_05855 [Oscillospiraceae bacterium]|nr:hypothetical protein [Oscillospiraceae bacterium]